MTYTYRCTYCHSTDVETIESARFNPNKDYAFVEMVESCCGMDWCNECDCETSFDEVSDRKETLMKEPDNE
jgi:hypothetical protein